jgi:hypothetical protein
VSDFSALDAALAADGIDPALRRLPRCACGQPRAIVAYDGDRMTWGCRDCPPQVTSVVVVQASCDGCDDATEHQIAELSNGDTVAVCGECPAVTVMRPPVEADA